MRGLWTTALAALVLAGGAVSAFAQDDNAALEKKKADKLAEAWVTAAPWVTDYAAAKAKAKETGKPIVAYFSRSYAP